MQKLRFVNGNGVEINLTAGRYGVTEWSGFSNADLNIQSQQVPFQDGAVFLDALYNPRELTIRLAINDNNNLEKRYELKRELIAVMNAKLGEGYLYYKNDFLEKRIKVIPQLPIFENKNSNDSGTLKASLTWTAPEFYWEDVRKKSIYITNEKISKIVNSGDINASIELTINGEETYSPEIRNNSTKKRILIDNVTTPIYINTNIGEKQINKLSITKNSISSNLWRINFIETYSIYILTGENGIILTSPDGIDWNVQNSGVSNSLAGVTYSKKLGLFCIVGNDGIILTSPDGINWNVQNSGITQRLNDIIYSENLNLFVAVGNNGIILTSPDGINWNVQNSGITENILRISTNGMYLVFGAGEYIKSSSDGEVWSTRFTYSRNISKSKLCFIKKLNKFIYVCIDNNVLHSYISENGNSWNAGGTCDLGSVPDNNIFRPFLYYDENSEQINCFFGNSTYLYYSQDEGLSWNKILLDTIFTDIYDAIYSEFLKKSILCGYNNRLIILQDFENYSQTYQRRLNDVIYSENLNLFVAVGDGIISTSYDGMNWNDISVNGSIKSITYSENLNLFVAVGNDENNGIILTSTDGINWTRNITSDIIKDVMYSEKLNLFIGLADLATILTSPDGINWISNAILDFNAYDITYSEKLNLFVVVGSGNIARSQDIINWENISISGVIRKITYSEELSLFCAIRDNSILTSPDGINWNYSATASTYQKDVFFSRLFSAFIVIGEGRWLMSYDGVEFVDMFNYFPLNGYSLSENSKNIVCVGDNINILSYKKDNSIIDKLNPTSDLSFYLQPGENDIVLLKTDNVKNAILTYRQKYLGV